MPDFNDIPGTRNAIERVTRRSYIYGLFLLAMAGGCVFIAGLVQLKPDASSAVADMPEPILMIATGIIAFTLFFPMFMTIYFAGHFLAAIKRLEHENRMLREKLNTMSDKADAGADAHR